VISCKLR